MSLRVGFMGTPDFALEALKRIHGAGYDVVCVYSQPPRPKGRGHQVQKSPVHAFADEHGIPVYTPKSLKSEDVQAEFTAHNLDTAVVAAYGLLLPKAVLDAPTHGCINIHGSLLPRWRGASPMQRAIWAGDAESGVTIMQMDEGLDTGPEILKKSVRLADDETASTLHDKLADLGADMTIEVLTKLAENGQVTAIEQEKDGVEYAHLLKKEHGKVDWAENAAAIDRQIRALNPWPGVYADLNGQRFKIKAATPTDETTDQAPGTILDNNGMVACGEGAVLQIQTLQPAGKQAMDFKSALNGGYIKIGDVLT